MKLSESTLERCKDILAAGILASWVVSVCIVLYHLGKPVVLFAIAHWTDVSAFGAAVSFLVICYFATRWASERASRW